MASLIAGMLMVLSRCSSSSQADAVDANTKVLASNVVVDNTRTTLSTSTLQSGIEELAPVALSGSVIVGTWDITNYPDNSVGKVTFSADGTYRVTAEPSEWQVTTSTLRTSKAGTYDRDRPSVLFSISKAPRLCRRIN